MIILVRLAVAVAFALIGVAYALSLFLIPPAR